MMQLVMTFFSVVLVPIFLRSQWKFSSLKYWFNLHIYSCQIANVVVAYIHANDYIAFFFFCCFLAYNTIAVGQP